MHTHCGFPIKAAQDMAHAFDVQPGDTMYWVSDIGWMMGPWELFGMTLLGGTAVLYDGALDYPGPDRLWALVERHGVNILGVSPTLIRALMKHGDGPVRAHDLSSLRILGSTGEPWNPEPWRWLFETAGGGRVPIINYSGGTEVSGGLVAGNVLTPLKPAAFAGPPPGIAADVVDDQGRPVRNRVGELVVRAPWIGMTRGFWRDPERYEQTYWSRFPGVWVHGDWAVIDDDGLWYILGRSDDTIKIAGKRLGPAEVESVLVEHPAVLEAAAIGVPDEMKGQALVCFCVLRGGHEPGCRRSSGSSRRWSPTRLGKPLKPAAVLFVRRPAQDPQRQSDAPRDSRRLSRRSARRSLVARESPGRGRDCRAGSDPAWLTPADFEARTYRAVTWRLLPFLFLCYILAYLDRVNVGFARLQMQADLGLSDTAYGIGAGIFFIGYFFFEVPSNLLLRRVGARLWIARIMVMWGLVSSAMMFIEQPDVVLRAALPARRGRSRVLPRHHPVSHFWYPRAHRRAWWRCS